MYEFPVKGDMKAVGWREGSSGIFLGSIEGLYQGYRIGSASPDQKHFLLDLPNGNLAITLQQELPQHFPLPTRPTEHPFRDGRDPLATATTSGTHTNIEKVPVDVARPHETLAMNAMEVSLLVDESKCTGIFAKAGGTMKLSVPQYKIAGYIVVTTNRGNLYMNFLEKGDRRILRADLKIDGIRSTGIYQQAEGELSFSMDIIPPNLAQGSYSGTLWLTQQLMPY